VAWIEVTVSDRKSSAITTATLVHCPCYKLITDFQMMTVTMMMMMRVKARHHCQRVRSMMLFYLKCQSSVTLLQLLNSVLLLPAILSPQLVLWLSCLIIPLLCFSLMGSPLNRQLAKTSHGKNQTSFVKQVQTRALHTLTNKWSLMAFQLVLLVMGLSLQRIFQELPKFIISSS